MSLSPDLPRGHMVRALNCMAHRDQHGAARALHAYFDCATKQGGPASGRDPRAASSSAPLELLKVQERVAQHAVLCMAGLHWHFGQLDAAAVAVEETVRLAQENGNDEAIALALGWLAVVMT